MSQNRKCHTIVMVTKYKIQNLTIQEMSTLLVFPKYEISHIMKCHKTENFTKYELSQNTKSHALYQWNTEIKLFNISS